MTSKSSNKDKLNSSLDESAILLPSQCSICLVEPIDKQNLAFSDKCLHPFCFSCLKDWVMVKPECPLCKQQLTSILHNVKANLEYEEYIIPKPEPEQDEDEIFPGLSLANMAQFIRDDMVERGDPDAQNPVLNIHVFDLTAMQRNLPMDINHDARPRNDREFFRLMTFSYRFPTPPSGNSEGNDQKDSDDVPANAQEPPEEEAAPRRT